MSKGNSCICKRKRGDIVDRIVSAACIPEEDAIFSRSLDEMCLFGPVDERERLARLIFEKNVQEVHRENLEMRDLPQALPK